MVELVLPLWHVLATCTDGGVGPALVACFSNTDGGVGPAHVLDGVRMVELVLPLWHVLATCTDGGVGPCGMF